MSAAPEAAEPSAQPAGYRDGDRPRHPDRAYSPFLPVLVLALAVLAWSGFQTVMLVKESQSLATARENQEKQTQAANKIRQALDAVARDTAKLADRGNAGARLIVDELRKRGVTINPEAPPPASK